MLEKTVEKFFIPILLIAFFLMACAYNLAYFNTFGDSYSYFLYVPMGFADIIKTGLVSFLLVSIFLIIFKPIFLDPAFQGEFPGPTTLLVLSALVFISNLLYFVIFTNSREIYSMVSELLFYCFSLVCFFGILYFFTKDKSQQFLLVIFFCSLIPISLLVGWINARIDISNASDEAKSKILLKSNKVVSAKILRSFEKGIFVLIKSDTDINFIAWDEIKEAKFKRVSGL